MYNMEKLEELRQFAEKLGADRAVIIPTSDLKVRTAAWAKCFSGMQILWQQYYVSAS